MKKFLPLLALVSLAILSTSCSKENLKKVKKELTNTNAKSQGTGSSVTPPAHSEGHTSGCPHGSTAG